MFLHIDILQLKHARKNLQNVHATRSLLSKFFINKESFVFKKKTKHLESFPLTSFIMQIFLHQHNRGLIDSVFD